MAEDVLDRIYGALVDRNGLPKKSELSPKVQQRQPANFLRHVVALTATKLGDGIVDPKLVLSWLLGTLGASPVAIGLLVPLREAGALLPQLALSRRVDRCDLKKRVWALGAFGQGACVLGMAIVARALTGREAGWAILAFLGLFALSRSLCSVSYRPLQGATLVRATRGTSTGTAGTLASIGVFLFGGLLAA